MTCREIIEEFGGRWIKVYPYEAGMPDRLLVLGADLTNPNGRPAYAHVETKAKGGKLSARQVAAQRRLTDMGATVATVNDAEGIRNLCKALTAST